jgi:hypothetical protein
MSYISDPTIALPQIIAAMQNDPRVKLAQSNLEGAGSTAPAYGWGVGLGRLLQGITGGISTKANEAKYGGAQQQYMDDVKGALASVLSGQQGATPSGPLDPTQAGAASQFGLHGTNPIDDPRGDPRHYRGDHSGEMGIGGSGHMLPPNVIAQLTQLAAQHPEIVAHLPPGIASQLSAAGITVPPPPPPGATGAVQGSGGVGMVPGVPGSVATNPNPPPVQTPPVQAPPVGAPPLPGSSGPPPGTASPGGGNTGAPIQGSTPPPPMPGMPAPPGVPSPMDSTRLRLGQALMGSGSKSPFSFMEGLQDVNAGLEEKARNEALAEERRFHLDETRYTGELNNYFGAQSDKRSADYTAQRDERQHQYSEQELRERFNHDWLMQKDTQGFQAGENAKERMFNTYKLIADTTGELPTDLGNMTPDAVFGAVIQQESSGDGTAKSEKGALGSTQMLPGTAKEMADKLGIEYKPELLQSNDPEALAYQKTLGRAYFNEGLDKYGGDIRKALMYYHGGPDEAQWGPKTKAYVAQVLGRLPGTVGVTATSGSGSNLLFGINPNANRKRPVPTRVQNTLNDIAEQTNQMLNLRSTFNDQFFGYGSTYLGRAANLFDEKVTGDHNDRVEWWKSYDMMNNQVRHGLFGSALTKQEIEQWNRSVVDPGSKPEVARKRLDTQFTLLQKALSRNARSASAAYNGRQVYEQIGGDDLANQLASDKPLTSAQQSRAAQVSAGGGIPKGFTVSLGGSPPAPKPQQQPALKPNNGSFVTNPGGFNWLTARTPFDDKLAPYGYKRF